MHMTIAAYQVQTSSQLQQAMSAPVIKRKQAEPLRSKHVKRSVISRPDVDADTL